MDQRHLSLDLSIEVGAFPVAVEVCMLNKENIHLIIRKSFPYLFEKYGFKEFYYNREYGRYGEGFVLGLHSDKCRLLFVKEPELKHLSIWVGMVSSPFENPDASGIEGWFNILAIYHFCNGKPVVTRDEYHSVDPGAWVQLIGNRLEMGIEKIFDLFRNKDTIESWILSFRDFVRENYENRSIA